MNAVRQYNDELKARFKALNQSKWGKRYDRAYSNTWKIGGIVAIDSMFLLSLVIYALGMQFTGKIEQNADVDLLLTALVTLTLFSWLIVRPLVWYLFWRSVFGSIVSTGIQFGVILFALSQCGYFLVNAYGLSEQQIGLGMDILSIIFLTSTYLPFFHILAPRLRKQQRGGLSEVQNGA